MTDQLTALIEEVLRQWKGPLPRLAYVTDAGDNETKYFHEVLDGHYHFDQFSLKSNRVAASRPSGSFTNLR